MDMRQELQAFRIGRCGMQRAELREVGATSAETDTTLAGIRRRPQGHRCVSVTSSSRLWWLLLGVWSVAVAGCGVTEESTFTSADDLDAAGPDRRTEGLAVLAPAASVAVEAGQGMCVTVQVSAGVATSDKLVDGIGNLLFVVDQAPTMAEAWGGVGKWQAAKEAISAVFASMPGKVNGGAILFPTSPATSPGLPSDLADASGADVDATDDGGLLGANAVPGADVSAPPAADGQIGASPDAGADALAFVDAFADTAQAPSSPSTLVAESDAAGGALESSVTDAQLAACGDAATLCAADAAAASCANVASISSAPQVLIQSSQAFANAWQAATYAPLEDRPIEKALGQADVALRTPPTGHTAVVLITDGAPSCGSNESAIAARLRKERNIETYVIGLPGAAQAAPILDTIAIAGGTAPTACTAQCYLAPADANELKSALVKIATTTVERSSLPIIKSCTMTVRYPKDAEASEPHLVATEVASGQVFEVPRASGIWSLSPDGQTATLEGTFCENALAGRFVGFRFQYGCIRVSKLAL